MRKTDCIFRFHLDFEVSSFQSLDENLHLSTISVRAISIYWAANPQRRRKQSKWENIKEVPNSGLFIYGHPSTLLPKERSVRSVPRALRGDLRKRAKCFTNGCGCWGRRVFHGTRKRGWECGFGLAEKGKNKRG